MTHSLVLQGTNTGGALPDTLTLDGFEDTDEFDTVLLTYVDSNTLTLDSFTDTDTSDTVVLTAITVSTLTLTDFTDTDTSDGVDLVELPFVAVNAETTALLAECTGTYSTTNKIQIDTFITNLKDAGVWSKLDWFYGGRFMANEHDSLLDWTAPTRTLVKVGGAVYTPFVGWTGQPSINNTRLNSGWNIGDGPHSTSTSLSMFVKVESIVANENGMQPIGVWRLVSGGGPATPDGSFASLSLLSGTAFGGCNLQSGQGNTAFAPGTGVGLWAFVRNGGTQKTYKDGVELESDAVSAVSGYTHADGMAILGSAGLAKRSFNGVQSIAGWGAGLSPSEVAGIGTAYDDALEPPTVEEPVITIAPSYSNVGGTGNRASLINVTTTATKLSSGGGIFRLVDGSTVTGSNNGSYDWVNGQTLRQIKFDFYPIGPVVITEATWKQNNSATHGSWKWQGSHDDATYVDIGVAFTLGGTAQVQTELAGNTTAYRYYKLLQVSGTTNDTPWIEEIEFKIGPEPVTASTPSYGHPQGAGNRTSTITATTTATPFGASTAANLVDGAFGDNATDAFSFNGNGQTGLEFKFDFGSPRIVDEAIWMQDVAATHGTWKWRGSNDDATYTDIGGTFTLGGVQQIQTSLNGNTTAYRYYKLVGAPGGSSFTPWNLELNFRVDRDPL